MDVVTGEVALRELGEEDEEDRRREKKLPLRRGSWTGGGGGGSGSFLNGLWLFFTGSGGGTYSGSFFDPKIGMFTVLTFCCLVLWTIQCELCSYMMCIKA